MKKILSLLSMLMITVTAFATSYTDQLNYKLTVFTALTKNLPAGELTVEPYGTSNYTVTAKGCDLSDFEAGNWDEIVCEDVAGTTDANGVTTITLDNPYAYRTSDNATFTATKLVVKFNGTKAYAHFEGKMPVMGVARAFEYTFGTDEGFESTGGGETGGEDKPAIVTVKENFQSTEGSSWGENVTIDWNTQKLVASINLASTGSDKGFLGVTKKGQTAGWNNYGIIFYNTNGSTVQGYAPGQPNNANTDQVTKGEDPVRFEISKDGGVKCQGNVVISASNIAHLTNQSEIVVGAADKPAGALYNYIKVVPLDWKETTEPTEPEVTVTFEKQYADQLYSLADGTPSAMGDATVTLKEMSDNTISMSLAFTDMNVESTDLVKGTDEKERITYTGTANFQGTNYAVKALRYTKDEAEKLYMTLIATDGTTLAFGTDPDYVAPEPPSIEGTVVEGSVDFAANGSKFEWSNIAIDWNKQKLVAVIDLSTCVGTNEDILSVGQNISAWKIGGWHFYYTKSDNRMKSDYLTTGGAHPISDAKTTVEPGIVRIELSKAEGCTIDGVSFNGFYDSSVTGTWQSNTADFWALTSVNIGSKEGNGRSNAVIKYVTVVDIETTTPDTPEAVVYNNDLTVVRGADHKVYNDAEVTVLAKGEGKYEVTLPEFADMDLTNSGTVGKIVFTANGEEVDGVLQLTAENAAGVISTGEDWANYAADVTMSGEVVNNQLAAKFTVVLAGMPDYTYELGFGKEIFIPTTETVTDWANIKFGDSDPVNIENAKLDITMVSMSTAMVTFKDVVINGNTIGDFAISGVQASLNPEDYTTILTTEATNGTWVRTVENNALGVFVGDESDIRNFEGSQDEEAGKTIVKFGVFFGSAYGWADIVFGEKVETPEPPVEDYAINFDKDAKQNHVSRYSTSVSLQQTGKDKQTIEFGKTMNGYEDLTADKFTVEAGSEVTPSIGYVGEWMHGYVYIDLDNNKQFSFNADGADQTGTEVVSYSYYKNQNSKGEAVESNCNVNPMPSFTAPTTPGTYRIRFKVDWDNIDAGGSVATGNSILNNGGGIYDATLEVVEPVTDGISTINAEVANGEAQLFTVDGVQIAKLQKGLNIVRTADGKVKKVLVK